VLLKDTLLKMERKTSIFQLSEMLKLISMPNLLPKEKLTSSLIFGKLKDQNVDKSKSPRNTKCTFSRNSIKTSLKVLVPLKDTPSNKERKPSRFHSWEMS